MSRILTAGDGKWFDELKAVAYYDEADIENWIHQHASSIFPHYFVFPYKRDVVSRKTAVKKRPDLAMIRTDFSAWSVVEVELKGHGLNHVLEQTGVFIEGNFNAPEVAEYARKQLKKFCNKAATLKRLTNLFATIPPSVIVITDTHASDWQQELKRLGVDFCVFEVYKNVTGHFVYRTFGQYPVVPAEAAQCRPLLAKPNLLEVIGNFKFRKLTRGRIIDVAYDEYLTRWSLLQDQGKQYLQFMGVSNPLSPNATYGLFRDKSDKYYFTRN